MSDSEDDYNPSDDDSYDPSEDSDVDYDSDDSYGKKPTKKTTNKKAPATKKETKSTTKKTTTTKKDTTTTTKTTKKPSAPTTSTTKKTTTKKKVDDSFDMDVDMDDDDDDDDDYSSEDDKKTTKKAQPKKSITGEPTIEEKYQKKQLLDQILLRPDTYIGSTDKQEEELWVWENDKMVRRKVNFVPGLYKIFDEILVNAADNLQNKAKRMTSIKVEINPQENKILVWNDGAGIPVEVHKTEKMPVPELIFGHLLTSSNYNDNEQRLAGGRNGFGAKLANAFSKKFLVECADSDRGKLFKQTFSKNMKEKEEPKITEYSKSKDYTQITFYPDLEKFGLTSLNDDDNLPLLTKRVYDIAGCNPSLKVYLNGKLIEISNFEDYIKLYFKDDENQPVVFHEKVNDRWEIAVTLSDGSPSQVSFANSICTTKGGTHVNHAIGDVLDTINAAVKKKKITDLKPAQIKNHLFVFVNALIVNPAFDSQTKETLTSKVTNFGSSCKPSDKFLKKIVSSSSGIVEQIISWAKHKESMKLITSTKPKKGRLALEKLDEANLAGGKHAQDCTLILTEGDSAKTLATAGISVVGRDHYGCFPLRGKMVNVRESDTKSIITNEEVKNVTDIMGFVHNKTYDDVSTLRYGHLMIMTDQDHDGSHIKGLLINFIHHFWPSLLRNEGFLMEFITPIVKVFKGSQKPKSFYTIPEFLEWKEANNNGKGYEIKYYKGLGTSKPEEGKEYFSELEKHKIDFQYDEEADDNIDLVFNKKRADDRKKWMQAFQPGTYLEQFGVKKLKISDFINKELILFSIADCERSIPSIIDGLKISQRKILYSCFKRNLKKEIRVAQLIGYVSENSAYHHGEQSLSSAIIGMAQDYVGSNNINLLYPSGSFGSRLEGGKDASSARYIHTRLRDITRCLFPEDDDELLSYLNDDGKRVQPRWYLPIIPMVLVNGSSGIGTGYSTNIPNHNPHDLIKSMRQLIKGEELTPIKPWYRGFKGEIEPVAKATSTGQSGIGVNGIWKKTGDYEIVVTELPIGFWTQDFKQLLEKLIDPEYKPQKATKSGKTAKGKAAPKKPSTASKKKPAAKKKKKGDESEEENSEEDKKEKEKEKEKKPLVKSYNNQSTESTVHFTITTLEPVDKMDIVKTFKLNSKIAFSNMTLFDENGVLKRYETATDIINEYYKVRIDYYQRRKTFLCDKLDEEFRRLSNKARFILAVVNKELVISNVKRVDLTKRLEEMKFEKFFKGKAGKNAKSKIASKKSKADKEEEELAFESDEENEEDDDYKDMDEASKGFDYLLSLPLWSLTLERVKKIQEERDTKKGEYNTLFNTAIETLYSRDLDRLEKELIKQDEEDLRVFKKGEELKNKTKSKGLTRAKKAKKRSVYDSDDDDDDYDGGSSKKKSKTNSGWKPPPKPVAQPKKAPGRKKAAAAATSTTTSSVTPATSTTNTIDNYFTKLPSTSSTTTTTTTTTKSPTVTIDDDDDDQDFVQPTTKKISPPLKPTPRATATKKKKVESSDEEEEEEESESEYDFDDESDDDYQDSPIKKPAKKSTTKKPAAAPKKNTTTTTTTSTTTSKKPAGKKSSKKKDDDDSFVISDQDSDSDYEPVKPVATNNNRKKNDLRQLVYESDDDSGLDQELSD